MARPILEGNFGFLTIFLESSLNFFFRKHVCHDHSNDFEKRCICSKCNIFVGGDLNAVIYKYVNTLIKGPFRYAKNRQSHTDFKVL